MKKKIKLIIAAVIALACIIGIIALCIHHKNQMSSLEAQLNMQHESELKLQKVISDLQGENLSLANEKESLADQIAELTTEEVVVFDAGVVMDEIKKQAEKNAVDNKILEQASEKAEQLVRSIIEATPGIRETYTISFEAAKK